MLCNTLVPGAVLDEVDVLEVCPSPTLLLSWRPPNPFLLGAPAADVSYLLSYSPTGAEQGSEVNIAFPYEASQMVRLQC